jgi:glycosyltransferase involved in cell wall biosynthesis/SAM-dependent methyltransferase
MTLTIGADIDVYRGAETIAQLLSRVGELRTSGQDWRLFLAGFRNASADLLVWNEVENRGLGDVVEYWPYTDVCRRFPIRKRDADQWIDNQVSQSDILALGTKSTLGFQADRSVLFVSYMHPWKPEGNSRLMLDWLQQFRAGGYRIHLLYYEGDPPGTVTEEMRAAARRFCDLYHEVPIRSNLVGWNQNGRNVHVDDWCGPDLLDEVTGLVRRFSYDMAFVNYAFMSAVFDRIHAYTQKVLLTHDRFENRNERLLAEGFSESAWMSLTRSGERLACERADTVIALQSDEADYFREVAGNPDKVVTVSPVLPVRPPPERSPSKELRIGYFGSHNWVNEQNLGAFMREWLDRPDLRENSSIVLAGGICGKLEQFIDREILDRVTPRRLGHVDDLATLFAECDVVINPERGGTGLKIKSLETMAHGMPLLSTRAGAVGFDSESRYHNAEDFAALADLLQDLARDRRLVSIAIAETNAVYDAYSERSKNAVSELIGTKSAESAPIGARADWPPKPRPIEIRSTPYIDASAAGYHFDLFEKVAQRVDLTGKRILEIGSDYHLISARLFMENGARSVVATNIGNWKSEEPLPEGISFLVGDMGTMDLEERGFDLVYGIAILEHIPDFAGVVAACKRVLAPDGIIFLQGCPIWGGSVGHHVWYEPDSDDDDMRVRFSAGGPKTGKDLLYRFSDAAHNPIPNWAHLSHAPAELSALLARDGVPEAHADGIVDYVYNLSGNVTGSCSNFRTASEIVSAFRPAFDVAVDSWQFGEPPNEHYAKALDTHSRYDLDTLGVELWLRHPEVRLQLEESAPKVSVIVPFFDVEGYISECLESIRAQDYPSLEIILIDDRSPDNSRTIAERAAIDDDRIRLVTHAENRGLGLSRNTGVDAATGRYLLFLDSDDVLAGPSVVRTLVNAARATDSQIVTGRSVKLVETGGVEAFDVLFEAQARSHADTSYSGLDAYRATFGLPGSGYLPMRAWGYLVDADLYRNNKLDFPAGAHEDVGLVPTMCYLSNRVHYLPEDVVKYRFRSTGISNSPWTVEKSKGLANVWQHFKGLLTRVGLEDEIGFAALMTARQALWKMQLNSAEPQDLDTIVDYVATILDDVRDVTHGTALCDGLGHLSDALDALDAPESIRRKAWNAVPAKSLIFYHRERLGLGSTAMCRPATEEPPTDPQSTAFIENDRKANALLEQYRSHADEAAKTYPSMLTEGDKAVYYDAARTYRGEGTIVDGGCFVGGTTHHLVQGLKDNPAFDADDPALEKVIKVYDLFQVDEDYILEHLERNFPKRSFELGGSFESVFREQMATDARFLEVFPGDVMKSGYTFDRPIEVLGVDLCKALPVTDYVLRTFFPRVLPGGLVIQQDFIHEFHPHIHLSMLRLDDYFDLEAEMKWGGSVTFRLRRELTQDVIKERFGQDETWFHEADTNVPLLESLIDRTLYDENRWVMILTLGFYHYAIGDQAQARAMFRRALAEYPDFEPSEITRRHLDGH